MLRIIFTNLIGETIHQAAIWLKVHWLKLFKVSKHFKSIHFYSHNSVKRICYQHIIMSVLLHNLQSTLEHYSYRSILLGDSNSFLNSASH